MTRLQNSKRLKKPKVHLVRRFSKVREELLQPDPELWSDQAENWRDRMMSLADQLVRPWSGKR